MAAPTWIARTRTLVHERSAVYLELTKPRITLMVMLTVALGFVLAPPVASAATLVHVLIGTLLSCSGAGALNQLLEQDRDAVMERTRFRPLPARKMSPQGAAVAGGLMAAGGVAYLLAKTNALTAAIDVSILVSYLCVYTPLKRRTTLATLIGAVPGALPPVMGWAAAAGRIDAPAAILFAIMFLWQIPHFLAIGRLFESDYRRAGFAMLSLVDGGGRIAERQMVYYALALIPVSMMMTLAGLTGPLYAFLALAAGCGYLAAAVRAAWRPGRATARGLLLASVLYLPAIVGAMLLDRLLVG
ncbi:MAG: protoheme IX farnesyltransferase [Deltaproteobacteria bacterium]|nr:MAG: protoheme IX farnesyltransferase [Deltaproteobacteria bacterium]